MMYSHGIRKSISHCLKEIRQILYWRKIDRLFLKNKKTEFSISFPHKGDMDNSFKIEGLANRHGYTILDEKLTTNSTKYFFKKV